MAKLVANGGDLGPVIQSIVSLMSSLVVKMLTVLVTRISNSKVFLLKKKMPWFINMRKCFLGQIF